MELASKMRSLFRNSWISQVRKMLFNAGKNFIRGNGPLWAAAIAYYSLLSIFPLLLLVVSIAAFFVAPEWAINEITYDLGQYLPSGQVRIGEIMQEAYDARGGAGIISLLLLLWTGSGVFGVLTQALNIAFNTSEPYGFFTRTILRLGMVFTLGLLFIAASVARFIIAFLWNRFDPFPVAENFWLGIFQELISALLIFVVLYLTYRYVPNRKVDYRSALVGSLFTTLVILIARPLFLGYMNLFSNFNLIYGSLAIVVILLIWVWVLAVIILFGGQITSETQSILWDGPKNQKTG